MPKTFKVNVADIPESKDVSKKRTLKTNKSVQKEKLSTKLSKLRRRPEYRG